MVKCKKCGFDNSEGLKFCGNCGARLGIAVETLKFESLALLHITGSAYLLMSLISSYYFISLLSNVLIGESYTFIIIYLISGLLGLYASYELYTGKISKYLKMISALAIVLGLVSTSILFWLGLLVMGIIGPGLGNILDKCMDAMEGESKAIVPPPFNHIV